MNVMPGDAKTRCYLSSTPLMRPCRDISEHGSWLDLKGRAPGIHTHKKPPGCDGGLRGFEETALYGIFIFGGLYRPVFTASL
ncbi:MAG: hypothetical protein ACYDB1_08320, partial [Acidiferrobacteraceae bacterium]